MWKRAVDRLEREQGSRDEAATIEELLPYIDFSDAYGILNAKSASLPGRLAAYLKGETAAFDQLAPIRNRVAHVRPLNFDDLPRTLHFAERFIESTEMPWRELKETLRRLKDDPSFVLGLLIPSYDTGAGKQIHNLPTPDFDETGFLGREKQVGDLTKLCLGPYPVITIFGEGGAGKTALALKVAYDFLEREECPFDAIVWTTAKAAKLTPQEVVRIEGAIADSLGLFREASRHLGGAQVAQPMEDIIGYLTEFKILLILDNLETVLDDRVKGFLERLPSGSKVLITSRIGLGAFDFPYKLQSLSPDESIQLLRAVAAIRGLDGLLKMSNKKLREYCERMKHNPGFIKWFASAVQAGKRPEEVLAKPHVFLDFCMTNVYEYLGGNSKRVLGAMLSVPGRHSQAELAYLTHMEALPVQQALQQLVTTNFVQMTSIPYGSSFESRYNISELAREFLAKHYPLSAKESAALIKTKRQLIAAGEKLRADQSRNPYSFESITTRSQGDLLVARYLLDALEHSKRGDVPKAEKALTTARELAPEFFEVYRVEALVRLHSGNIQAARDAYEAAIALEPRSAPLRLWYANFLVRYFDDLDLAFENLQAGLETDPDSNEIKLEIARIHIYRRKFPDAKEMLDELAKRLAASSEWFRRKHTDAFLTYYQRYADLLASEHDSQGALAQLIALREYFETIPSTILDHKMRYKIGKAIPTVDSCVNHLADLRHRAKAYEILGWITDVTASDAAEDTTAGHEASSPSGPAVDGTIRSIRGGYGFIESADHEKLFFHRHSLTHPADWTRLHVGGSVTFTIGADKFGRKRAESLRPKTPN